MNKRAKKRKDHIPKSVKHAKRNAIACIALAAAMIGVFFTVAWHHTMP